MKPTPRILLGRRLFWTEKRDGSNIAIWLKDVTTPYQEVLRLKDERVQISSRNNEVAASDFQALVKRTAEYEKIENLLIENPQFVCYVEACRKGRSITGAELFDHEQLILFDIYDRDSGKFLPYVLTAQHAYHHKVPVVKLYAETRHRSMKDLLKYRNHVLGYCKEVGIEGMVIKPRRPYIKTKKLEYSLGYVQAKIKLDVPEPIERKIVKGEPIYPAMPVGEVLGCIDKVYAELGSEKFQDVRTAMPMIAKVVGEACSEHLYSKPIKAIFKYYKEYLERQV